MKTKLLYGGLVLLAFGALLFGQATFGPSGGGSSSSNTNGFDSSQFNVSTGGVVTIKDGAVVSNLVGKASATSAKAFSTQSGTNFIRDPVRPAVDFSTDPANFAIEIFSDSSGTLGIYSADAVTNVAKFDANGLTLYPGLYLAPNPGLGGSLALNVSSNALIIGGNALGYVRVTIANNDVLVVSTNQVTNSVALNQSGPQTNYNGVLMAGGQFQGNGAGLTNVPFSGLKNGFTNAVLTAGSYTNVATDFEVMMPNGSVRTNWLQTNVTTGAIQAVKDWGGTAAGTNIIVKATAGLIDRAATYTINANYGSVGFLWDGTNYWSIWKN